MTRLNQTSALTAALILGLSSTTSAQSTSSAPTSTPTSTQSELPTPESTLSQMSTQLMAIQDAVEATKSDPSAMCFVVALPENYQDSRTIRDLWTTARKDFNQSKHQVFFVRGQDAEFVLENSFIESSPATIAFRNGRPFHSRTGIFTQKNLHAFLALAFDNSAPTTNAPDQTQYLYESMNELAMANQDATAAQGACSIMLNLHALIQGPYASTYSPSDIEEMTTLYNQTQLSLASLNIQDQSVLDQIDTTRAMAIKTWNKRTNSTFGIGIWMDLAFVTGNESEIIDWIDQELANPANADRVAQSLSIYGQSIAQLLIDNNHYEALAMTISSPEQITEQFESTTQLASEIAAISGENSFAHTNIIKEAAELASAYHASLILVGRDSQAWEIAELTQDFAGPELASASLCSAAIAAGALTDRHAFLVDNLDQSKHASIINAMNTSFAVVPGADD